MTAQVDRRYIQTVHLLLGIITHMQKMKTFKTIGLIGLAITIVLNIVALLMLKKVSAEYFSDKWWSEWFPLYMIWLVFITFGFVSCCRRKTGDTKHDA